MEKSLFVLYYTKMREKITRKNIDVFLAKYASSERILDIGSGGSSYDRFFPNRLTIDIDPNRKPDVVADAHNLPFKDGEVQGILSVDVCEHLKDPARAVAEMHRVLKRGGRVIFITRFIFPIHDSPNDYWRFTKYGLRHLFRDFEIFELVEETRDFATFAVLLQRLGYQTKLRLNKVSKLFVFLLAALATRMNWLIKEEYGDIGRRKPETGIMASGYYLVAQKR